MRGAPLGLDSPRRAAARRAGRRDGRQPDCRAPPRRDAQRRHPIRPDGRGSRRARAADSSRTRVRGTASRRARSGDRSRTASMTSPASHGALGLERLHVVGWSGGGPHALASAASSAYASSDRRRRSPAWRRRLPRDSTGSTGWLTRTATSSEPHSRARTLSSAFLGEAAEDLRECTGESVAEALGGLVGEVDRRALSGPFADYLARCSARRVSQGIWGWLDDDLAFARDWGFSLGGDLGSGDRVAGTARRDGSVRAWRVADAQRPGARARSSSTTRGTSPSRCASATSSTISSPADGSRERVSGRARRTPRAHRLLRRATRARSANSVKTIASRGGSPSSLGRRRRSVASSTKPSRRGMPRLAAFAGSTRISTRSTPQTLIAARVSAAVTSVA